MPQGIGRWELGKKRKGDKRWEVENMGEDDVIKKVMTSSFPLLPAGLG